MAALADFLSEIAIRKLGAARLLHVGRVLPDPGWGMKSHLHGDFHELIVVEEGRFQVRIRGQAFSGEPGDMFLYPARESHEEQSDPSKPVGLLFLGFEWDLDLSRVPLKAEDAEGRARLLMEWLYAGRGESRESASGVPDAMFRAILAFYLKGCAPGDDELVTKIRGFIRERIGQPITLDDLARRAGMSKYHFVRRYRALSGRTPMEDVRALRVEFAREMILTTDLPLKAIAPRAGISSEYALSKMFRKVLGSAPGALRRRAGAATSRGGS
jgi:AraC-like DNA-binding protein/quercetin dioxygenase-like cupin family protein